MHTILRPALLSIRGMGILLLCLGLLAPPLVQAGDAPGLAPFHATYTAAMDKGISLNGTAERTLEDRGDGTWMYRTRVNSLIANIDESLVLRWVHGQVIPLSYRYQLSGFLIKNREKSIDFDWGKGRATGKDRGKEFSLALEPGTLDPLGFQLQLRQDIRAGKQDMRYRIINKGKYDEDRFAILDKETLDGANGPVTTIKAEKVRGKNARRETLMWFAPGQDYLLVRLRQVEPDGTSYELRLKQAGNGS